MRLSHGKQYRVQYQRIEIILRKWLSIIFFGPRSAFSCGLKRNKTLGIRCAFTIVDDLENGWQAIHNPPSTSALLPTGHDVWSVPGHVFACCRIAGGGYWSVAGGDERSTLKTRQQKVFLQNRTDLPIGYELMDLGIAESDLVYAYLPVELRERRREKILVATITIK
ncbi:MAG: hypothetical protein IPM98_09105 [Lewinellaceae bacterium]|nr:hypothetical protein [Lewinellaceae bacterium]